MNPRLSRRELLWAGSIYGGGVWVALQAPPARAVPQAGALDPHERRTIEAFTGRILPADDEPGAIEAGCVEFIDRALAGPDARALPLYRSGVQALDAAAQQRAGKPFIRLPPAAQDAVLAEVQAASPLFFETARAQTVIGFLADPKHGGNRDHVGWKVVGYPGPRHAGGGYTPEQMRGEAPIQPVWSKPSR